MTYIFQKEIDGIKYYLQEWPVDSFSIIKETALRFNDPVDLFQLIVKFGKGELINES
jgi:hypothetical protein